LFCCPSICWAHQRIRIPTPKIGRVLFFQEANESIDCAAKRSEPVFKLIEFHSLAVHRDKFFEKIVNILKKHFSPQSSEIAQDTMLYVSENRRFQLRRIAEDVASSIGLRLGMDKKHRFSLGKSLLPDQLMIKKLFIKELSELEFYDVCKALHRVYQSKQIPTQQPTLYIGIVDVRILRNLRFLQGLQVLTDIFDTASQMQPQKKRQCQ
ncbi:hypothetical protein T10_12643, partial [Trichinella papuae]